MVMRPVKRDVALEAVELFRRMDAAAEDKKLLTSEGRADSVIQAFSHALVSSLSDESRIRGWKAQSLFRSLVVALDACLLLVDVDRGEIFFDGDRVKAPDFFLHLRDGRRMLVDVKAPNVLRGGHVRPVTFSASEYNGLLRFGELYGAEVFIALHIPGGHWTLVPLEGVSRGPGGGYRIELADAMTKNHFGALGDRAVGVRPPLEIASQSILSDTPSSQPSSSPSIDRIEYRDGARRLKTLEAQTLVSFFVATGDWEISHETVTDESGVVIQRVVAAPEVRANPEEHFEFVGTLSTMYSRYFEGLTTTPGGNIAIDVPATPGSLARLIPDNLEESELDLWIFELAPG